MKTIDIRVSTTASFLASGLLAITLLGTAATAQITFYVQPGDLSSGANNAFDTALTLPYTTHDFSNAGQGVPIPQMTGGGTTVSQRAEAPGGGSVDLYGFSGCCYPNWPALINGWYSVGFLPVMVFEFSQPIQGFGGWVFDDGNDSQFVITATEVGGATSSATLYQQTGINDVEGFAGVVSATGLVRVTIEDLGPNGPANPNSAFMLDDVRIGGPIGVAPASYSPLGAGCPGSLGLTGNVATAPPSLGTTMTVEFDNVPLVAVALLSFASVNLDVSSFGLPGCTLYSGLDITELLVAPGNKATWSLPIANSTQLLGLEFYSQAFVLDAGINPFGGVLSDAATAVIGY